MATNDLKNVDIFPMNQMEVVIKGGDPSKACYDYRSYSSVGSIGRGALSETEKSRIRNYTTLNTTNFAANCNALNDTANTEFTAIIKELRDLKDKCGEDVFSLNGETMQDDFEEIAKAIENYLLQISEYTEALIARGKSVSAKQETICENTIKWMNMVFEQNQPKVELYKPPQNVTVIK